jgi:hypothetical protein
MLTLIEAKGFGQNGLLGCRIFFLVLRLYYWIESLVKPSTVRWGLGRVTLCPPFYLC